MAEGAAGSFRPARIGNLREMDHVNISCLIPLFQTKSIDGNVDIMRIAIRQRLRGHFGKFSF